MTKHAIPDSALDDRFWFVGTSGSGKTPGVGVERLLDKEARLDLSDQFTDPTKGVGECTLQLFDGVPALAGIGGTRKGVLLATWKVSLSTPESNRAYWDRTTRTYLFKFPMPENLPKNRDQVFLTATLTLPNGATLSDELALPLK